MMKQISRKKLLFLILLFLAVISGYLLSKPALIGRAGITFFYREYTFLKTWWKGAFLILIIWMVVYVTERFFAEKAGKKKLHWIHIGSIILALTGLYLTYYDFRNTISHRLLGERFHLGGYLFWTGWILIAAHFLLEEKSKTIPPDNNPFQNNP